MEYLVQSYQEGFGSTRVAAAYSGNSVRAEGLDSTGLSAGLRDGGAGGNFGVGMTNGLTYMYDASGESKHRYSPEIINTERINALEDPSIRVVCFSSAWRRPIATLHGVSHRWPQAGLQSWKGEAKSQPAYAPQGSKGIRWTPTGAASAVDLPSQLAGALPRPPEVSASAERVRPDRVFALRGGLMYLVAFLRIETTEVR